MKSGGAPPHSKTQAPGATAGFLHPKARCRGGMADAVRGINRTHAGISNPGYSKTQAQFPLGFGRCELGTMADQRRKTLHFARSKPS
jgi:hypothetical protein